MDTLLILVALLLIAGTLYVMARVSMRYLHGTFTAWGAKHYAEKSGEEQKRQ